MYQLCVATTTGSVQLCGSTRRQRTVQGSEQSGLSVPPGCWCAWHSFSSANLAYIAKIYEHAIAAVDALIHCSYLGSSKTGWSRILGNMGCVRTWNEELNRVTVPDSC